MSSRYTERSLDIYIYKCAAREVCVCVCVDGVKGGVVVEVCG